MGIPLCQGRRLENPILVANWRGMGDIGIAAVDTLRGRLGTEELGQIEPWDFYVRQEG